MPKMNVRKGDKVEVITGKDKGKQGEVLRAMPKDSKVIVDGAAIVKRHTKPNAMNQQGGIIEKPAPIHVSNRYEVSQFIQRCRQSEAVPLSQLTEGLHLHTVSCRDQQSADRVRQALEQLGFLYE